MFDVISIGDSTLDAFFDLGTEEAKVLCELNKEDCVICLNYADKIPAKSFTRVPAAGNAANNAVGSARLGMQTAIYTILGKDEIGEDIANAFKSEGIDQKYLIWDNVHGSNVSIVLNYEGERTIIVYHQPRIYGWPADFGPTKWIYYTSIGKNHASIHEPLLAYLNQNQVNFAFNPGTWQLKEGLSVLEPLIQKSTVFAVNKQEAQGLVGEIEDVKELLAAVKKHCGGIVLITDGDNGSATFDGQKYYQLGLFPAHVIEKTGAGDSYTTAFAAALFYGRQIPEAMAWGGINSASVIEQIGPQAGLLRKEQIITKVEGNPEFRGKEF